MANQLFLSKFQCRKQLLLTNYQKSEEMKCYFFPWNSLIRIINSKNVKKLSGESRKNISIKLLNKCKKNPSNFIFEIMPPFWARSESVCSSIQKVVVFLYLYIMVLGLYYYVIFHAVHKTKQLQQHTREMFLTEKKERKKRSCATYCTYIHWHHYADGIFYYCNTKKNLVFKTIKMFL